MSFISHKYMLVTTGALCMLMYIKTSEIFISVTQDLITAEHNFRLSHWETQLQVLPFSKMLIFEGLIASGFGKQPSAASLTSYSQGSRLSVCPLLWVRQDGGPACYWHVHLRELTAAQKCPGHSVSPSSRVMSIIKLGFRTLSQPPSSQ